MALSEYERKMLEELETQLSDEDPGFVDTLKPKPSPKAAARQVSIRHLVLGLLVVFGGIAILALGVSAEMEIVGLFEIVVMFPGTWYMTTGIKSFPIEKVENSDPGPKRPKTPRSNRFQDFMAKQAEEWEKRHRRQRVRKRGMTGSRQRTRQRKAPRRRAGLSR